MYTVSRCTLTMSWHGNLWKLLVQDHLNTVNWLAVFCDEVQVIKVLVMHVTKKVIELFLLLVVVYNTVTCVFTLPVWPYVDPGIMFTGDSCSELIYCNQEVSKPYRKESTLEKVSLTLVLLILPCFFFFFRYGLTGTALQNNLSELWNILNWYDICIYIATYKWLVSELEYCTIYMYVGPIQCVWGPWVNFRIGMRNPSWKVRSTTVLRGSWLKAGRVSGEVTWLQDYIIMMS